MALESMLRRNTHLLNGIPMVGQGLAGIVEQDNRRLEECFINSTSAIEERKVTFQRISEKEKSSQNQSISKEDQETLNYFSSLRQTFTEPELLQVLEIISILSYQKESIASVLELLKEESEDEVQNSQESNEVLREKAAQF